MAKGYTLRFICKENIEHLDHFLFDFLQFKENLDSIWRNLELKIIRSNPTDGIQIANFIKKLDRRHMLLVGGLSLLFDNETTTLIKKFISSAVGKIYKLRTEKLHELEAPWLTHPISFPFLLIIVKFTVLYIDYFD